MAVVKTEDVVNHPSHYAEGWSNGAEVIDISENLNFNRGNAVKYIARAGKKDAAKEVEDLEKAEFYLKREIRRIKNANLADKLTDTLSFEASKGYDLAHINAMRGQSKAFA